LRRKKDHLKARLEDWGEWLAKTISGIGHPSMSTEGKCIEYGYVAYKAKGGRMVKMIWPDYDAQGNRIEVLQELQLTANGSETVSIQGRPLDYETHPEEQTVDYAVTTIPDKRRRGAIYCKYVHQLNEFEASDALVITVRQHRDFIKGARIWVGAKLDIDPFIN